MFTVILLMLSGLIAGYLARGRNLKKIQPLITILIWILLFLLGLEVGENKQIVYAMHTLGIEALLLCIGGMLGSVMAARILWRLMDRQRTKGGER